MPSKTDARCVLVGGAEGALGRAAISHFVKSGKTVIASCRTPADREKVQEFIRAERLDGAVALTADLSDEMAVARLVADGERQVAPIDGMFNAAGGFRYVATADCSANDFDFLVSANLRSSFFLAKHVVPGMKARGFGRIVLVSSRASLGLGEPNLGVYTATKAAVNALVQGLAAEMRKTGVTVNAVMPTTLDTAANRAAMPKADPNDWVKLEELLTIVSQLMGPSGAPINGALIPVAGRL